MEASVSPQIIQTSPQFIMEMYSVSSKYLTLVVEDFENPGCIFSWNAKCPILCILGLKNSFDGISPMKKSDNKTLVTWITTGVKTTHSLIMTVLTVNSLESTVAQYLPDREMRQRNLAWLFETYSFLLVLRLTHKLSWSPLFFMSRSNNSR